MLVSGLLFTDRLSAEGLIAFTNFRSVVDELVAFVDQRRAAPGLHDSLRGIGARVVDVDADKFYEPGFAAALLSHCRGDWILKLDHDEELSPEWFDARWRQLLESGHTHFWSPRRWLTERGAFLAAEPWWPDWQMRLFRNVPDQIQFPTRLHENPTVIGSAGALRTLAIHHHDLRLASRLEREAKVAGYEKDHPGPSLAYYYLYEDFAPPELPLPAPAVFDPQDELLQMQRLETHDTADLRIELVDDPPSTLRPAELFWIKVRVYSASSRPIGWGMPAPVNLSYHWLDPHSEQPIVFDGHRTALFPPVLAGSNATYRTLTFAPTIHGEFILRLTLVQEGVRWLDEKASRTVADRRLTICA